MRNHRQGKLDLVVDLFGATDEQIRTKLLERNPGLTEETITVQLSEFRLLTSPEVRENWSSILLSPTVRAAQPEWRHYRAVLVEARRRFRPRDRPPNAPGFT